MEKNLYAIGLPKWPALVVVGNSVTEEQAMEILIRTDSFYFGCNDPEWEEELHNIVYGVRSRDIENQLKEKYGFDKEKYSPEFWTLKESFQQRYAPIELCYLTNSRIASSWIGGPHGWCSWNGKIGCSNYNIGKWPSVEEVHNDWVAIASEFPFLDLRCQLMNEEAGESDIIKPLIEFIIKEGKVEMYEPTEILDIPSFGSDEMMIARFGDPHFERGCSLETAKEAFEFVEKKIKIDEAIKTGKIWIEKMN
jgi:hypothetical protein